MVVADEVYWQQWCTCSRVSGDGNGKGARGGGDCDGGDCLSGGGGNHEVWLVEGNGESLTLLSCSGITF
ncbi:hypothetical protein CsSME_00020945 [Camellia sinensis var. sinensis]